MNVTNFQSANTITVGVVRAAAEDLRLALGHILPLTMRARDRVRSAKTLDKIVRYYADWLGAWHCCNVGLTFALHADGGFNGRHAVAYLQIKSDLRSIEHLIAAKSHWMALPNIDRTRLNIDAQLRLVIGDIESAIRQCAILAGEVSPEGLVA